VYPLVTTVSRLKRLIPFGLRTRRGPRNHTLYGDSDSPSEGPLWEGRVLKSQRPMPEGHRKGERRGSARWHGDVKTAWRGCDLLLPLLVTNWSHCYRWDWRFLNKIPADCRRLYSCRPTRLNSTVLLCRLISAMWVLHNALIRWIKIYRSARMNVLGVYLNILVRALLVHPAH